MSSTPEGEPDIYDIEFKDIYEIDFADIPADNVVRPAVERLASESLFPALTSVESPSTGAYTEEVRPVTQVKAESALDVGSTAFITTVEPPETVDTHVLINETAPEFLVPIPLEIQTLATRTITTLLSESEKPIISYDDIATTAYGDSLPAKGDKWLFIEALKRDGRIEYFKKGKYLVIDRSKEVEEAYMAGLDPLDNMLDMDGFVEEVLGKLRHNNGEVSHKMVLGTVSGLGRRLNKEEVFEFMRRFITYPGVIAKPDGNFVIKEAATELNNAKAPKAEEFKNGVSKQGDKPIPRKQIQQELRSDGVVHARDVARPANPRRHGKNFRKKSSRQMGRNHGKKKSIDQLIAEMHAKDNKPE